MTDLPDKETLRKAVAQVMDDELRNRNISLDLLDDPKRRLPRGLWESIRSILNERGVERPGGGPWTSNTEITTGYVCTKAHKVAIFSSRVRELILEFHFVFDLMKRTRYSDAREWVIPTTRDRGKTVKIRYGPAAVTGDESRIATVI